MKEITYSFIIPHKNCPIFLSRCIDSIPMREDVQIIVVDDNSDLDQKPSITWKGVEVVLLDEEHAKGAGRARNVGLSKAKGKWLLFADADDCYTDHLPVFLEKYANDNTTDIVYLNASTFDDNGIIKPHKIDRLINHYIQGKKNAEMELRYSLWNSWLRMVKKEVVVKNNILFDEIPAGNDVMFGLNTSFYSNKVGVEKEIVYQYYQWPNGSITTKKRRNMIMDRILLRGKIIAFYKEVGYHCYSNLFGLFIYLVRNQKLSIGHARKIYCKQLKEIHVFWGKDISCFFCEIIKKIIQCGYK